GFTLNFLVENADIVDELVKRAEANVEIRILICSPDNLSLPHSIEQAYSKSQELVAVKSEIERTRSFLEETQKNISDKKRKNFKIKQLEVETMYMSIRRFDEKLYVLPYFYSMNTPQSPVFLVTDERKPLFKKYMGEFETLFKKPQKQNSVNQ